MKTYIRIQNTEQSLAYLTMHLSQKLLSNYAQIKHTPLAGAYFKEYLPKKGEIYNSLTDTFQIAGQNICNQSLKSSITQRLDYHSNMKYTLTEQLDILESSSSSTCVFNDTNNINAVIIFCGNKPIYYQQISANMTYALPSLDELIANWSISYISSTQDIPVYFSPDMSGIQPLWSGSSLLSKDRNAYMTFLFHENTATGEVNLSGPDYTSFPIV